MMIKSVLSLARGKQTYLHQSLSSQCVDILNSTVSSCGDQCQLRDSDTHRLTVALSVSRYTANNINTKIFHN